MSGKLIFLLSLACACAAAARGNAPQPSRWPIGGGGAHPRASEREDSAARRREGADDSSEGPSPETVLSVHYDRGLIKELYLSQTRGRPTENATWSPSVHQKRRICQDLCQAGLGGDPCGSSCEEATPALLDTLADRKVHHGEASSSESNTSDVTAVGLGVPRTDVCPILCANGLGMPLCICQTETFKSTTWSSVCEGFCRSDSSYQLMGCPACRVTISSAVAPPQRASQPSDFWVDWCKAQCKIGEGGAACKCDLAPMSL